jgi:retron-type reverse transcriptase
MVGKGSWRIVAGLCLFYPSAEHFPDLDCKRRNLCKTGIVEAFRGVRETEVHKQHSKLHVHFVENQEARCSALALREIQKFDYFNHDLLDANSKRVPRCFRKAHDTLVCKAIQLTNLMKNDGFGKIGTHDALYERIISTANLFAAWREFKSGKLGKKDVLAFSERAEEHLVALHDDLASGTYVHGKYHRFFVHDPKRRPIAKASVRDRVLHHAICRIIGPMFDKQFIFDSYASRKGKGTHAANERLRVFALKLSRNGTRAVWLMKCDICKFFDSVDHDILLGICEEKITDEKLLALLHMIVTSFETRPGKGIPLGNLTSQLLANVYMDLFDQFVKRNLRFKHYIRYTDDFVLLSCDKSELEETLPRIQAFLMDRLRMELHPQKIFFRKWRQGFDFLGYVHFPYHTLVRTKTMQRIFRKLTQHHTNAHDEEGFDKLEQAKQSYLGILSHANAKRQARDIRHGFRSSTKSDVA